MGRNKKAKKAAGGKKRKLVKIVLLLVFLGALGAGINFYRRYMEEQRRLIALEEQRRREEEEKERLRKLLEQKRREFDALVEEMKKHYYAGDFPKAREAARKALALAAEYDFPTGEIYKYLRLMDVAEYTDKLNELKKINEDIYKHLYVRSEVLKIPDWDELKSLRVEILNKTYENEYLVTLILAKENAITGRKGELASHHYFISREYLEKAVKMRQERGIARSPQEDAVRELQRELFFSSKELMEKTTPPGLY